MTLGVVLAGGQSTRFGSDKALAELHGQSLLSRAVEQMRCWCEEVVVWSGVTAPLPLPCPTGQRRGWARWAVSPRR
ncbi:MAG: NTP transferase domain-containing protein [Sphingomonadaceae bacterium]